MFIVTLRLLQDLHKIAPSTPQHFAAGRLCYVSLLLRSAGKFFFSIPKYIRALYDCYKVVDLHKIQLVGSLNFCVTSIGDEINCSSTLQMHIPITHLAGRLSNVSILVLGAIFLSSCVHNRKVWWN